MKSILIIGGLGMLGSEVLKEFANTNYNIHATYRSKADLNSFKNIFKKNKIRIRFHQFDIRNFLNKRLINIIKKKEIIINCAGIIKPYIF